MGKFRYLLLLILAGLFGFGVYKALTGKKRNVFVNFPVPWFSDNGPKALAKDNDLNLIKIDFRLK